MKKYYKILGLSEDATQEEFKKAYETLVRKYEYNLSNYSKGAEWENVIGVARKLIDLDKENINGYIYFAIASNNLGKHEDSIKAFSRAEDYGWDFKRDLNLYFMKALSYIELQKFNEASEIIESVVSVQETGEAYAYLAYCYDNLGIKKAKSCWKIARELEPTHPLVIEHSSKKNKKVDKNNNEKKSKKRPVIKIILSIIASIIVIALLVIGGLYLMNKINEKIAQKDEQSESIETSLNDDEDLASNEDDESSEKVINEGNDTKDKEINDSDKKVINNVANEKLNSSIENIAKDYLGDNIKYFSIGFKDIGSGDAITINNKIFNSASVIKIYIMAEVYNQVEKGIIDIDEKITVTNSMKVAGSGVIANKKGSHTYSIEELIEYMIIDSDNTAANALTDMVGMDNINSFISSKKFSNTSLNRKMMDVDMINAGVVNDTCVIDLIKTFELLEEGNFINEDHDKKMLTVMKKQKMRSKIPGDLPRTIEVANKSGELENIENDAGIVYTDKGAYALAILLDGPISNKRDIIANLSKLIYEEYLEQKE